MAVTDKPMGVIGISTTLTTGPNRQMVARARSHEIRMDVRTERGGDDAGPTPPECMLMALGGCVINLARIIAGEMELPQEHIGVTVSGGIDPSKAFGLQTDTRAGFSHLSIQVDLQPEPPVGKRNRFLRELSDRCPLCDTIINPTPLEIAFYPPGTDPRPVTGGK